MAEKLMTQLLVEGCYGVERAFIWPMRNPPFMHLQCACALLGVEQGHVNCLTNIKLYAIYEQHSCVLIMGYNP